MMLVRRYTVSLVDDRRRTGPEQREPVHWPAVALVERLQRSRSATAHAPQQLDVACVLGSRGVWRHRALVLDVIQA